MVKGLLKKLGFAIVAMFLVHLIAFAQEGAGTSETEPDNVQEANMESWCKDAEAMGFPDCANSPSECASKGDKSKPPKHRTPFNCIFLQEPIGGKPGYDLYKMTVNETGERMVTLWYGEAILEKSNESGPFQAILSYEEGKEAQGPFGLLYNYLGLVYNFISGIIVGFAVLVVIVGGIMISTGAGDSERVTQGKGLILKVLVGMVLWFTASVILYTINPTFFAF